MLFGHEKGAFTGATERRIGVFEAAEGGTVFLDEVGELPLDLQPRLLRVLERREVVRVGTNMPRPVNVRVLSATWRDLRTMINRGSFREDLYYRLAQARVVLPPLRERPEDISILARHFLDRLSTDTRRVRDIDPYALEELAVREYGGNVRELKSTIERAALVAEGDVITPADLAFERLLMGERDRPQSLPAPPMDAPLGRLREARRSVVDEFEKGYLQRLMTRFADNISRAAAAAGVERHYLRGLLRKHGLRGEAGE
jgi:DNA-binding NtrC family response regulator